MKKPYTNNVDVTTIKHSKTLHTYQGWSRVAEWLVTFGGYPIFDKTINKQCCCRFKICRWLYVLAIAFVCGGTVYVPIRLKNGFCVPLQVCVAIFQVQTIISYLLGLCMLRALRKIDSGGSNSSTSYNNNMNNNNIKFTNATLSNNSSIENYNNTIGNDDNVVISDQEQASPLLPQSLTSEKKFQQNLPGFNDGSIDSNNEKKQNNDNNNINNLNKDIHRHRGTMRSTQSYSVTIKHIKSLFEPELDNQQIKRMGHLIKASLRSEVIIAIIMVLIPWITGFACIPISMKATDEHYDDLLTSNGKTNTNRDDILQITSYSVDVLRYLSMASIVMAFRIAYNSFSFKLKDQIYIPYKLDNIHNFDKIIQPKVLNLLTVDLNDLQQFCCICPTCDTSDDIDRDNNSNNNNNNNNDSELIELRCIDNVNNMINSYNFKESMISLTNEYREIGKLFKLWIYASIFFNTITYWMIGYYWYVIFLSTNTEFRENCKTHWVYYLHYGSEFVFFMFCWLLAVEPLISNHDKLRKFNTYFKINVATKIDYKNNNKNDNNSKNHDKHNLMFHEMAIHNCLDAMVKYHSPFRVGRITPTYGNLRTILVFLFITSVIQIFVGVVYLGLVSTTN